jgi:hypothetical protein
MNDTIKEDEKIKQERSPSSPIISLEGAIALVQQLYKTIGKSKVIPVKAASALGYAGISGASLTTLAALRSYGLIDRAHGEDIAVSAAAIRILHPVNETEKQKELVSLALKPKVFEELFTAGFTASDYEIVTNHLVQRGLTPERARKSAAAYCANYEFANLSGISIFPVDETANKKDPHHRSNQRISQDEKGEFHVWDKTPGDKVLAKYSIPLGACVATIEFTGDSLATADFDDLAEFAKFAKKQWERKSKTTKVTPPQPQALQDPLD